MLLLDTIIMDVLNISHIITVSVSIGLYPVEVPWKDSVLTTACLDEAACTHTIKQILCSSPTSSYYKNVNVFIHAPAVLMSTYLLQVVRICQERTLVSIARSRIPL